MLSSDGGWSTEPSAAEGDPSQIPPAVTLASRTSSSDDLQVLFNQRHTKNLANSSMPTF